MEVYIYDPRTNITEKISYEKLERITGNTISTFSNAKANGTKIRSINCYVSDDKPTVQQRRKWYGNEKYKNETWLMVEGSKDRYKVSNYGRVKRLFKNKNEMFMLPFRRHNQGNLYVKIWFLGKYTNYKVGHIVAHHFIRPRRKGEVVIRKNGIRTDDYAGNLEYISESELGKRTGHLAGSKAVVELCPTTSTVINEYRSAREAGRKTYMSYQTVLDNCHGITELAAGVTKFMFLEDYEKSVVLE